MTTDTMTTSSTGVGVETIVSALENGVVGIPPEAAMGAIIQWESTLASSGDADLQTIATDLATLRGALTTGASFTGGSTTMQNQFDNDTDNAATGKSGGGI